MTIKWSRYTELWRCVAHGFMEDPGTDPDGERRCPMLLPPDDGCDMPLDGPYAASVVDSSTARSGDHGPDEPETGSSR